MIYLDHAATSAADPCVIERMREVMAMGLGNPSSLHSAGRRARQVIDDARDTIASALGVDFAELVFTSGGTEADNLAVLGAMRAAPSSRPRLIVSSLEHHAVLHAAAEAGRAGAMVDYILPDPVGRITTSAVRTALDDRVALVSVMHANNETGVVMDVPSMAGAAHQAGALFHTDAVQSFGALPVLAANMGCDLASISAHKVYGPPGVGALYIRRGVRLESLMHGGSQERGLRAGTESAPAIAGFAEAVRLLSRRREEDARAIRAVSCAFAEAVLTALPNTRRVGGTAPSLPGTVNIVFQGVDGTALVICLDRAGVAASTGAACAAGSPEPSHVLLAMGLPEEVARSSVRFSFGRSISVDDAASAADVVIAEVRRLRTGI